MLERYLEAFQTCKKEETKKEENKRVIVPVQIYAGNSDSQEYFTYIRQYLGEKKPGRDRRKSPYVVELYCREKKAEISWTSS